MPLRQSTDSISAGSGVTRAGTDHGQLNPLTFRHRAAQHGPLFLSHAPEPQNPFKFQRSPAGRWIVLPRPRKSILGPFSKVNFPLKPVTKHGILPTLHRPEEPMQRNPNIEGSHGHIWQQYPKFALYRAPWTREKDPGAVTVSMRESSLQPWCFCILGGRSCPQQRFRPMMSTAV